MKQITKHIALGATPVFQFELFDEQAAIKLLLLTSNAPMSGAEVRSTEASAPLAGWAADQVLFALLCFLFHEPSPPSSILFALVRPSNLTARSRGLSKLAERGDSGVLLTIV